MEYHSNMTDRYSVALRAILFYVLRKKLINSIKRNYIFFYSCNLMFFVIWIKIWIYNLHFLTFTQNVTWQHQSRRGNLQTCYHKEINVDTSWMGTACVVLDHVISVNPGASTTTSGYRTVGVFRWTSANGPIIGNNGWPERRQIAENVGTVCWLWKNTYWLLRRAGAEVFLMT